MSLLEVRKLQKSFWQGGVEVPVLRELDLSLQQGQSLAITGASGVGKSTLLHCLGLIESFDQGEIYFEGQSVVSLSEAERVRLRREKIGFVFQFHYLMAELSALENVMIPLRMLGISPQECSQQASFWLDKVGLSHRLNHRPAALSGGEQQRVAIARALVKRPRLILADEPTGNLDPETAQKVFDVLKERCRELNASLLITTHNLDLASKLELQTHMKGGRAS